ncbi:hypothetical protein VNO78_30959 [Psophocarpus tetragonolobus]|uniref:Transmembrane protein n=1 Tax=Psophocarpus tetragonolobus TaxID=3891 RepID=A0AAN9X6N3_PSOTE
MPRTHVVMILEEKNNKKESVGHNSYVCFSEYPKLTETLYLVSLASLLSISFHTSHYTNKTKPYFLFLTHTLVALLLIHFHIPSPTPNQTRTNSLLFFFSRFSHSPIKPWRLSFKRRRFASLINHCLASRVSHFLFLFPLPSLSLSQSNVHVSSVTLGSGGAFLRTHPLITCAFCLLSLGFSDFPLSFFSALHTQYIAAL